MASSGRRKGDAKPRKRTPPAKVGKKGFGRGRAGKTAPVRASGKGVTDRGRPSKTAPAKATGKGEDRGPRARSAAAPRRKRKTARQELAGLARRKKLDREARTRARELREKVRREDAVARAVAKAAAAVRKVQKVGGRRSAVVGRPSTWKAVEAEKVRLRKKGSRRTPGEDRKLRTVKRVLGERSERRAEEKARTEARRERERRRERRRRERARRLQKEARRCQAEARRVEEEARRVDRQRLRAEAAGRRHEEGEARAAEASRARGQELERRRGALEEEARRLRTLLDVAVAFARLRREARRRGLVPAPRSPGEVRTLEVEAKAGVGVSVRIDLPLTEGNLEQIARLTREAAEQIEGGDVRGHSWLAFWQITALGGGPGGELVGYGRATAAGVTFQGSTLQTHGVLTTGAWRTRASLDHAIGEALEEALETAGGILVHVEVATAERFRFRTAGEVDAFRKERMRAGRWKGRPS